jgi:hypothetical protein
MADHQILAAATAGVMSTQATAALANAPLRPVCANLSPNVTDPTLLRDPERTVALCLRASHLVMFDRRSRWGGGRRWDRPTTASACCAVLSMTPRLRPSCGFSLHYKLAAWAYTTGTAKFTLTTTGTANGSDTLAASGDNGTTTNTVTSSEAWGSHHAKSWLSGRRRNGACPRRLYEWQYHWRDQRRPNHGNTEREGDVRRSLCPDVWRPLQIQHRFELPGLVDADDADTAGPVRQLHRLGKRDGAQAGHDLSLPGLHRVELQLDESYMRRA